MPSRKGRANRIDGPKALATLERDSQAWELRLSGARPYEIAAQLGVNLGTVYRMLDRHAARCDPKAEDVDRHRLMTQERLDKRRVDLERVLARSHPLRDRLGNVIMVPREMPDGTERMVPAEDDMVRLAAHDRLHRIDQMEVALWGLNPAIKWEHSGPDGGPIPLEVQAQGLLERANTVRLLPREALAIDATSRPAGEEDDGAGG